jgi:DeoR/GlpR family transcriptional regulator of sugar metabolism
MARSRAPRYYRRSVREVMALPTDESGQGRRREAIRTLVLRDGSARIDDLAEHLGVSVMTVHRDLDALAAAGWLSKIRGGATANPSALVESGVTERSRASYREKHAICADAASLLSPGQTVFIDDSTTALPLVPHLVRAAPITVVTNFLPVLTAVAGAPDVDVVLLGGRYQPLQEACFGLHTAEAIRRLHADLLFMSTTAVYAASCYHRSETTVLVKRAFMSCAARTVLLVDHAKFGRPAPHLLGPLADFDLVVTDSGTDPADLSLMRDAGLEVHVAQV